MHAKDSPEKSHRGNALRTAIRRFRVRVEHDRDVVGTVLRRMWDGGLGREGRVPRHGGAIRAVPSPDRLALFHAGRPLDRTKTLKAQRVPRGCKTLACLDVEKTKPGANVQAATSNSR